MTSLHRLTQNKPEVILRTYTVCKSVIWRLDAVRKAVFNSVYSSAIQDLHAV